MDNVDGGGQRERERWPAYLLRFSSLSAAAFFTRACCLLLCFYCFVLVLVLISLSLCLCARRASLPDILSCSSLFVKFSCFKSSLFYRPSFVRHRHPCLYLPETTDASSSASLLFVYQKQVRDRLWRSGRDNRVVLRFLELACV